MNLLGYAPYLNQAVGQIINRNRQAKQDALAAMMAQTNMRHVNAESSALENPDEAVTYLRDDQGNYVAVPKKVHAGGASGAPGPALPSLSSLSSLPGPSLTPSGPGPSASAVPSAAPTDTVPPITPPVSPPATPPSPTISPMATGIKAPPKAAPRIDPNSPAVLAQKAEQQKALMVAKAKQDSTNAANFGPNSRAAITADSVKANNTARANAQYPSNLVTTGTGPDGRTMIVSGKSKGPIDLNVTDIAKPATGGAGGSSLAPEDRAKMLQQAKNDNDVMKAYEQKVLAGTAHVGATEGIAGAAASAPATGIAGNVMSILGNTAVGAMDPEYQKYLTAQRSYGRIMGNLQSKRYTDHQAEIERSISGLQGNDLAGTIQYKQQLRDASLADPTASAPSAGSGGAGRVDLATRAQQLKAQGYSKEAARAQLIHEGLLPPP